MTLTTKRIKDLDSRFEHLIDNLLFETIESELTPEKREARKRAAVDDLSFAKIYYPDIFTAPWTDVHHHINGLKQGKYTVSGFRLLGKTAFTVIAKAVRPIAESIGGIINISQRTTDMSKNRTFAIRNMIMRNAMLVYDYNIEIQQDLKGYYIINNTTMIATSVEVGLRGYVDEKFKRFKISINDDLYNRQSVTSDLDNEKVIDFVTSEVYGQMEDDGLCITLGNSINDDCPIVRLKEQFPDNHFSQPALDEAGNSTWPERFDNEYWHNKKSEVPMHVWEGEYMDRPFVKGENFTPEMINYININLIRIVASITAADPAHGTSPESCYKSLATLGITNKNKVIMLDMLLRRVDYFTLFDYVFQLMRDMPFWKVMLFENDFQQWDFAMPYYEKWQEQNKRTIPLLMINSKESKTEFFGSDKESRVMNLVYPHTMKNFLYSDLLRGNSEFELYLRQLYSFGKAKKKLDGPDATATAYIRIFEYLNHGSFEPTKKRAIQKTKWGKYRGFR